MPRGKTHAVHEEIKAFEQRAKELCSTERFNAMIEGIDPDTALRILNVIMSTKNTEERKAEKISRKIMK